MKRKALITATAVLLVAVMCLATASYAWFTSGKASAVASLDLSVSSGTGSVEIAAADIKTYSYEASAFSTTALTRDDLAAVSILPSANALSPVSTDGVMDTFEDENTPDETVYEFFGTDYNPGTEVWVGRDELATDGYVLFAFYARNTESSDFSGKLQFTSTASATNNTVNLFENDNFAGAGKIGVATTTITKGDSNYVVNTGDAMADFSNDAPTSFTTYRLAAKGDAYQDMTDIGAYCTRTTDGKFIPAPNGTVINDEITLDDSSFAANNARYNTEATNNQLPADGVTVNIPANGTVLVTVAIWIDGMDPDCAGTWSLAQGSIDVTLAENNA